MFLTTLANKKILISYPERYKHTIFIHFLMNQMT